MLMKWAARYRWWALAAAWALLWWWCVVWCVVDLLAKKKKLLVLMFSTPDLVKDYGTLSDRINRAYAKRHGYDFKHVVRRSALASPQWEKVFVTRDALESHDAVFYIDTDAAFNQPRQSLDELLDLPGDFVGCSDHPNGMYNINTGAFLVRSTPWAKRFMDAWKQRHGDAKYHAFAFEQQALHDMINENVLECKARIHIEPALRFNSDLTKVFGDQAKVAWFVRHFMAKTSPQRRQGLKEIWETKYAAETASPLA